MQDQGPPFTIIDFLRDPPGSPGAVEQMRRYLGRADPLGGYLPQLALPRRQSELFVHFWFALRRIDDLLDSGGPGMRDRVLGAFPQGADFAVALAYFLDRAPAALEAERRIRALVRAIALEGESAEAPTLPAERLLRTLFHKAYVPGIVGFQLLFEEEDLRAVQAYAMLVGTGLQLTDDLLDLPEDAAAGRFWISDEELLAAGLDREGWQGGLARITAVRESVCLLHYLVAREIGMRLRRPRNRRLALRLLETIFLLHLRGRFQPGGGEGWRAFLRALAEAPGPEGLKYVLYNASISAAAWLGPPLVAAGAIRERVRRGPSIPEGLSPASTLHVMQRMEAEGA